MYCMAKFCHVCMSSKSEKVIKVQARSMETFRNELTFCVPEINVESVEFVCETCRRHVQKLYKFKSMIIRNESTLNKYKFKLRSDKENKPCVAVRADLLVSLLHSNNKVPKEARVRQNMVVQQQSVLKVSNRPAKRVTRDARRYRSDTNAQSSDGHVLGFDASDITFSGRLVRTVRQRMLLLGSSDGGGGSSSHSPAIDIVVHRPKRVYGCNVCGGNFRLRADAERHQLAMHADCLHVCSLCSKMFAHRSALGAHLLTHTARHRPISPPRPPPCCPICNKTFTHRSSVTRHFRRLHTP